MKRLSIALVVAVMALLGLAAPASAQTPTQPIAAQTAQAPKKLRPAKHVCIRRVCLTMPRHHKLERTTGYFADGFTTSYAAMRGEASFYFESSKINKEYGLKKARADAIYRHMQGTHCSKRRATIKRDGKFYASVAAVKVRCTGVSSELTDGTPVRWYATIGYIFVTNNRLFEVSGAESGHKQPGMSLKPSTLKFASSTHRTSHP